MKGRWKGTLLVAMPKDGNNGLIPVAFAVVSSETLANWTWFLELIRDHITHAQQILFLSDRHCGILSAFLKVFEKLFHFVCLYHLYTNLKVLYGKPWSEGHRVRMCGLLKEVAYAPNHRLFEEKLAIFKQQGGPLFEKRLQNIPFNK